MNASKGQSETQSGSEAHYYASGLEIAGLRWVSTAVNRFSYGGKEEFDTPLNWLDFHARWYDPVIMRWHVPDPHAEAYAGYSPYNYCLGNPVNFIDPTGCDAQEDEEEPPLSYWELLARQYDYDGGGFWYRGEYYNYSSEHNGWTTYNYSGGRSVAATSYILWEVTRNFKNSYTVDGVTYDYFYSTTSYEVEYFRRTSWIPNLLDSRQAELGVPYAYPGQLRTSIRGNTPMLRKFDINKAVATLNKNALLKSSGFCAKYVRYALEAGGINTNGRPGFTKDYDSFLKKKGFGTVRTKNYQPVRGDIAVMEAFNGKKSHPHGHFQMYNGTQWVSDFTQNDFSPSSDYCNNKPDYTILRWNQNENKTFNVLLLLWLVAF